MITGAGNNHGDCRVGQRVRVAHDVRIDVMKPADVERLGEPMCPDPDVGALLALAGRYTRLTRRAQANILLPPLQKLRTVVERMRIMSDVLAIRANGSGCLQLAIHTDDVSVDTVWRNCTNPKMRTSPASWTSPFPLTDMQSSRGRLPGRLWRARPRAVPFRLCQHPQLHQILECARRLEYDYGL